jgi:pimeloyl-ACP methyl ester carboxylesterase
MGAAMRSKARRWAGVGSVIFFPDELYQAPRSWAERAYPRNLIHYNRLDRGGHFAAWEQPDLFAAEMRASFRSLR